MPGVRVVLQGLLCLGRVAGVTRGRGLGLAQQPLVRRRGNARWVSRT